MSTVALTAPVRPHITSPTPTTATPTTTSTPTTTPASENTFERSTSRAEASWLSTADALAPTESTPLHRLMLRTAIDNHSRTETENIGDIDAITDEDELFLDSLLDANEFGLDDEQSENVAPLVYAGYFLAVAAARHLATKALTRVGTSLFKRYAGQMARYVVREVKDATGDAVIDSIMGKYNGSVNELMKKNRSALRGTVKDMFGKPIRSNQRPGGGRRVYNHTGKTKYALDGMRKHTSALEQRIRQGQADGSLTRIQLNTARKQLRSMENEYTRLNRKLNEIANKANGPGVFR